jgi:hypothetical protein
VASCKTHRHHLGDRVDVEAVSDCAAAQGLRESDRELVEERIDDAKPWHNLGRCRVAAVQFADGRFVQRTTSTFDLSHHLGGMGDVVDDERMIQRGFGNVQRRFLEDRRVKRTPAHVLTVGEQLVFRPHRAPVCFADGKSSPRERHLGLLRSWLGPYTLPLD